jgi:hypothetical protein
MTLTEAKFLLEPDSNQYETQHISEYVDNSSMQPNACNEAPAFVIFGNFTGFQCPHFQQPGELNMLVEPPSYQDYINEQEKNQQDCHLRA